MLDTLRDDDDIDEDGEFLINNKLNVGFLKRSNRTSYFLNDGRRDTHEIKTYDKYPYSAYRGILPRRKIFGGILPYVAWIYFFLINQKHPSIQILWYKELKKKVE